MSGKNTLYLGHNKLRHASIEIEGTLMQRAGEVYYKISNYDHMRPFFMSLTSDSDIWMFVSSDGGISAGRKNSDQAIFPYYTDDLISLHSEHTGSKSVLLVQDGQRWQLWTPFSGKYAGLYDITRNIYKNTLGNTLEFEEINHDLGLKFVCRWNNARKLGIIRKSSVFNISNEKREIRFLDGLINILPPGILQTTQQTRSNLANAYKMNELKKKTGIGIYTLSSNIVDRPEPSEALKASTVWSTGRKGAKHLLSSLQIREFMAGREIHEEQEVRGEAGAYLLVDSMSLDKKVSDSWYFVIDTNRSAVDIASLEQQILKDADLQGSIEKEIEISSENLWNIVTAADGKQVSADQIGNMRHTSNTLFNVMRGGIFTEGYLIEKQEFVDFIKQKNSETYLADQSILNTLPDHLSVKELKNKIREHATDNLERYAYEFLPITFSRRHGDPSRPWNKFNIDVVNEDGSWRKSYEGNWRDIFQNWEALSYAYPEFIENIITIFLNASTMDGYNPYRISEKGIDWEITDPDDPWSFIGYWGDHQIIYLLKLLEISKRFHPGNLEEFLDKLFFTYANVPYRIKGYDDIVQDPYNTIDFDTAVEEEVQERIRQIGADGRMVWHDNSLVKATLTEKLLIPLLTKLSNLVPEGGIWMNTQRPEWNDANNALVGHGLSMVTVYYMYRYLDFLKILFNDADLQEFEVGVEVKEFLHSITAVFKKYEKIIRSALSDEVRADITGSLGKVGEDYRNRVYKMPSLQKSTISVDEILDFLELSILFIQHTIKANRRPDHLYHAYNLIQFKESGYGVEHLYPMLEGQVAVLSSGFIHAREALEILDALRSSALYREDQDSYVLYPDRSLARFENKSKINPDLVWQSDLLKKLIEEKNAEIVQVDARGNYYFNPDLSNAKVLRKALDALDPSVYGITGEGERDLVLDIYEQVFNHHSFTGRSGKFFGYEGLGSIYWHMNSKLLLAVQEIFYSAKEAHEPESVLQLLKEHYYDIKEGLGTHKNPEVYGAFPIDPYSHTPANKGAQQPGMTGQVKEDLLSRLGELGTRVEAGCIAFDLSLIRLEEFLEENAQYVLTNVSNTYTKIDLAKGSLAFSFCQVPIVYSLSKNSSVEVYYNNDETEQIEGLKLTEEISSKIFNRTGEIDRIVVHCPID